jgi:signal transduction histidine kinase/ActR/RegA family two-component response regulator
MKRHNPSPKPFGLATYLDGLLFWSVFTGASVFMLWLLTDTTKGLLRQSVATHILTLSNMTAASLSPQLYPQKEGSKVFVFSDIPSEHLQAIQDQNPDIIGLMVVNLEGSKLRILATAQGTGDMEKFFPENPDPRSFLQMVKRAQRQSLPVLSEWAFLATRKLALFTQRVVEPEFTFTSIPGWSTAHRDEIPVVVLVFNAGLIQQQFLKTDDNSALVIAVTVLLATILSWLVQKRSIQSQEAVKEKLAAVNLLRQRDAILGRVAAAMDEVLTDKNFEVALQRLLREIGYELGLQSCYVCLSPLTFPFQQEVEQDKERATAELLCWNDLETDAFRHLVVDLQEGRTAILSTQREVAEETSFLRQHGLAALVLIPILFEKRLLGVMVLIDKDQNRNWDPGLLDSLKLAADLYGAAFGRREQDDKLLESSKIQALGRMAGGVAHEFNNLLHIIAGNLEQMLHRPQCQPDEKELISKILEAGNRGGKIVEQLLSSTRQSRSDIVSASLNDLVQKTVSLFQPVAKAGIQLDLHLDKDLPQAPLDISKIQQVILNLLLNANDAVSQHGKIELITCQRSHEVDGVLSPFVCCEVRDNGRGIDPENLEHLFDPFFTTKAPGHGTGLGLSTSRGILSQHGGVIEAQNREDGGAIFTFYLPFDPHATPTATTEEPVPPPDTNLLGSQAKGRILIADDEALCREVMCAILDDSGHTYQVAKNGEELLGLADTEQDVAWIITDWTMPGCHGADLARKLRKRLPQARIIVTSGFALNSQDIPEVDALIQKPFGPQDLFKVMTALERNFKLRETSPTQSTNKI